MPAAMMHLTVLVSLLTVAACSETTTISELNSKPVTTTSASHLSSSLATSPAVKTSTVTPLAQTPPSTSSPPSSTSTTLIEESNPSTTAMNTTTSQASNGTTTREMTESQNVTGSPTANTTSPALSTNWGKNSLAENQGLVAIICIFSIVLALMIVVVTVKCVQSPRSNFERLEDVPMGKVTEESPFAHFSK